MRSIFIFASLSLALAFGCAEATSTVKSPATETASTTMPSASSTASTSLPKLPPNVPIIKDAVAEECKSTLVPSGMPARIDDDLPVEAVKAPNGKFYLLGYSAGKEFVYCKTSEACVTDAELNHSTWQKKTIARKCADLATCRYAVSPCDPKATSF